MPWVSRWSALVYSAGLLMVVFGLTVNQASVFDSVRFPQKYTDGRQRAPDPPFPGPTADNLFWFVQVSDIHISSFVGPSIGPEFVDWCKFVHTIINPDVLLVTGDITDAKHFDQMGSSQQEKEWMLYRSLRSACRAYNPQVQWLEARGNHDAFDVPQIGAELYKQYMLKPPKYVDSFTLEKRFGNYSFMTVDFNQSPGPSRPFNFFGNYHHDMSPELTRVLQTNSRSNLTVILGHHTLNVVTDSDKFMSHLSYGCLYLCGHLHTLLNWKSTQRLYGYHPSSNLLELEVADFKDHRRFRIVSVDHDMLSFNDVSMHERPIIVITNPKPAQYVVPGREPLGRVEKSTHIRVLLFSESAISTVEVRIVDSLHKRWTRSAVHVQGPLWVTDWEPAEFSDGPAVIHVDARDEAGRESWAEHVFLPRHNATQVPALPFLSSWIISADLTWFGSTMFLLLHSLVIGILFALRYANNQLRSVISFPGLSVILRPLSQFSRRSRLFWPYSAYLLWLRFLPWFAGYLLHDQVAVVFLGGIWFVSSGQWMPSGLNCWFGLLHLMLMDVPVLVVGSLILQSRGSKTRGAVSLAKTNILTTLSIPFFLWECHKSLEIFLNYGLLAVFTNIAWFYSIFLHMFIIYTCRSV